MISLELLVRASEFYRGLGFFPLDVPLTIDESISAFTRPLGRVDLPHVGGKVYPASAEQSFLQLLRNRAAPPGRYQAITPCYRDEPVLDELHHRIFLKLELIDIGGTDIEPVISAVERFFCCCGGIKVQRVPEGDHIDLVTPEGVELGSYGVRVFEGTPYVYGTGLAEPRTSLVRGQ